jgi:hypothetical protein
MSSTSDLDRDYKEDPIVVETGAHPALSKGT